MYLYHIRMDSYLYTHIHHFSTVSLHTYSTIIIKILKVKKKIIEKRKEGKEQVVSRWLISKVHSGGPGFNS